jgi:hypothetical protein
MLSENYVRLQYRYCGTGGWRYQIRDEIGHRRDAPLTDILCLWHSWFVAKVEEGKRE